jgi:hypothetical protein
MEYTIRTVIIMIVLLVAAFVFVTTLMTWDVNSKSWLQSAYESIAILVVGGH